MVPATASRPITAPDIGTELVITAGCTIAGPPRGSMTIDSVIVLIGTNESFSATKGEPTILTENYIVYEDHVVNENYIDTDGSTKTRQVTKTRPVTKERKVADYQLET